LLKKILNASESTRSVLADKLEKNMSLIKHIHNFNKISLGNFMVFEIDSKPVGMIHKLTACHLKAYPNIFTIETNKISLNRKLDSEEKRTAAVANVAYDLYEKGVVTIWRDELYAVSVSFNSPPLMMIDRGAAMTFGIQGCAVFLNGYTYVQEKLHYWIARRSKTKKHILGNTIY